MSESFHDIIVIWLDAYIGDPHHYSRLKAAFSSNIDPTNPEPLPLANQDTTNTSLNASRIFMQPRVGIPCELKTFVDADACLQCIRTSLNADKQILLIVSDSIGRTFLPRVFMTFRGAKAEAGISVYIFSFCVMNDMNFMDWLFDYEEYVNLLVFSHEVDLLWRLVHDIAEFYTKNGIRLLARDTLVDTHQALIYFEWASALCHHARNITIYQDSKFIRDLENLTSHAEEKIENSMRSIQNYRYSRTDMERSLNSSLFIYHTTEFPKETDELVSTLNHLAGEQAILFDKSDKFIAKLKAENFAIKHYCPIVISSDNNDRMKILTELSALNSINHIYILDPNEHVSIVHNDQSLLESLPKVRNIYVEAIILALEWSGERASKCEKIAKLCTKNGDSNLANKYYAKAIALNQHLAAFIKNN